MEEVPMHTIDTHGLMKLHRQPEGVGVIVVDVSPRDDFYRHHIPGSASVPMTDGDFVTSVEITIGGRVGHVVVYDGAADDDASDKAAAALDEAGFPYVYHYVGGLDAWRAAGRPVQAGLSSSRMR
jgi:rhodanese-related sulfurtransferase